MVVLSVWQNYDTNKTVHWDETKVEINKLLWIRWIVCWTIIVVYKKCDEYYFVQIQNFNGYINKLKYELSVCLGLKNVRIIM